MKIKSLIIIVLSFFIGVSNFAEAAWTARGKKRIPMDNLATLTPDQHYRRAVEFYNEAKWDRAAKEFRLIAFHFPDTSYGVDAKFFLGVSYYHMSELDLANEAFDKYLKDQTNPYYFREAMEYKFQIAERFAAGEKKRYLSVIPMPKWGSGSGLAVDIYDDVIPAMSNDEMAAKALYGKGRLLWQQREYRKSVETFQILITRFPKSELAPECYLHINEIYLEQCQKEFQNPDLLALAEINLTKFQKHFPLEQRLEKARQDFCTIKEVYAKGLMDTATFYERIDQPKAAVIYYQKAIVDFPETHVATACKERLRSFCPAALQEIDDLQSL